MRMSNATWPNAARRCAAERETAGERVWREHSGHAQNSQRGAGFCTTRADKRSHRDSSRQHARTHNASRRHHEEAEPFHCDLEIAAFLLEGSERAIEMWNQ